MANAAITTKMEQIATIKSDLKTAIEGKGGNLSGKAFTEYANEISNIPATGVSITGTFTEQVHLEENVARGNLIYAVESLTGTGIKSAYNLANPSALPWNATRVGYLTGSGLAGNNVTGTMVHSGNLVVKSNEVTTAYFALSAWPLREVIGDWAEIPLTFPAALAYSSRAFTKALLNFTFIFEADAGVSKAKAYLHTSQQVPKDYDHGTYWTSESFVNSPVGDIYPYTGGTDPNSFFYFYRSGGFGTKFSVDITSYLAANSTNTYYFAVQNNDSPSMKVLSAGISVFY